MRMRPLILLALMALVVGCEKAPEVQEELPEVYTTENNSYMRDPEFIGAIENRAKLRNAALGRRERLLVQLEAMAANDPARVELEAKLKDLNDELRSIQAGTMELARERMNRALVDERLVAEGKAKAK